MEKSGDALDKIMIVPLIMVEYLKRKINSPSSLGWKVGPYIML